MSGGRAIRAPRRGFALIEVLVALAVLGIGLVAVLASILSTLALQRDSAHRVRAGLVLQETLAGLAAEPFDGQERQGVSADGAYSWRIQGRPWTVSETGAASLPDSLRSQVFDVEVQVSWMSRRGERSIGAQQLVRGPVRTGELP